MSLKETIREFKKDFVPKEIGGILSQKEYKSLKFRKTKSDELHRCGTIVGDDWPQSGYIYCGDIAEWINELENGYIVALCSKHAPTKSQRV
jgi:hypothetical protein